MINLKTQQMKKIISLYLFVFTLNFSYSQDAKLKINPVFENGLHQVLLNPETRSFAENNINYIRILDSKSNEVPYILLNKNRNNFNSQELPIISKNTIRKVATTIIIENEKLQKIDHLILKIANTDVTKKYNISGSNDGKEWFGLVDNQYISNLSEAGKTSIERTFNFPLNNYKLLKFDFIDKNSLPINILQASLESNSVILNSKIELDDFTKNIKIDKNEKKTKIEIAFKTPQVINEISFDISAPNFYLREAKVLVKKTQKIKNREHNTIETFCAFELNSAKENSFEIQELFTDHLTIEIDNEDNPPLAINEIKFQQQPTIILADLKSNENYIISIDKKRSAPNYDLGKANINFEQNYPNTTLGKLEIVQKSKENNPEKPFWKSPLFMWLCIGIAILGIAYFSLGMIKDLNKEK